MCDKQPEADNKQQQMLNVPQCFLSSLLILHQDALYRISMISRCLCSLCRPPANGRVATGNAHNEHAPAKCEPSRTAWWKYGHSVQTLGRKSV